MKTYLSNNERYQDIMSHLMYLLDSDVDVIIVPIKTCKVCCESKLKTRVLKEYPIGKEFLSAGGAQGIKGYNIICTCYEGTAHLVPSKKSYLHQIAEQDKIASAQHLSKAEYIRNKYESLNLMQQDGNKPTWMQMVMLAPDKVPLCQNCINDTKTFENSGQDLEEFESGKRACGHNCLWYDYHHTLRRLKKANHKK